MSKARQPAAQHCFAADAAGAARGLGAIFGGDFVPPAVPVQTHASGAAESWRWAALNPKSSYRTVDTLW